MEYNPYGNSPAPQPEQNFGFPQININYTVGLPMQPPMVPPIQVMPQAEHRLRMIAGHAMHFIEGNANREPYIQNLYLFLTAGGRTWQTQEWTEACSVIYNYILHMDLTNGGNPIPHEKVQEGIAWVVRSLACLEAQQRQDLMGLIQSNQQWAQTFQLCMRHWHDVRNQIMTAAQYLQRTLQNARGHYNGAGATNYGGAGGYPHAGGGGGYPNNGYGGYNGGGYPGDPYGYNGNNGNGGYPAHGNGPSGGSFNTPFAGSHNNAPPVSSSNFDESLTNGNNDDDDDFLKLLNEKGSDSH